MCELYLHSAAAPTSSHPWLGTFLGHAEMPFDNPDGWGLAFYQGDDAQLFHEPLSAAHSSLAEWVGNNPPKTQLVIGHIRKANAGGVQLSNTQPLSRAVGGRRIVFAHNGSVKDFKKTDKGQALQRRALGTADSEIALLALLDWLGDRRLGGVTEGFAEFARGMAGWGPFNMIVSDGQDTLAYSDRRAHAADGPDAPLRGPGLYTQRGRDGGLVLSSEPFSEAGKGVARGTALHIRGAEIVKCLEGCVAA